MIHFISAELSLSLNAFSLQVDFARWRLCLQSHFVYNLLFFGIFQYDLLGAVRKWESGEKNADSTRALFF